MLVIAKPMVLRLGLAAAVATTFLAGCAAHYRASDLVRAGPGGPFDTTQALALLPSGYRVETGSVATPDGERLYRVAFMHPQARSDLLLFGGNLFRSDTQAAFAARHVLAAWRGNLVLYDYRGRGQSSGVPSVAALRSDAASGSRALTHLERADPAPFDKSVLDCSSTSTTTRPSACTRRGVSDAQ